MNRRRFMQCGSLALCGPWLAARVAHAQPYPTRAIKLIVPGAAGSVLDINARRVSEVVSRAMGQPIVIDNRPGANGFIGMELAAKSKPDGYTLVFGSTGTISINPLIYAKTPYDAAKDFVPITLNAYGYPMLVVNNNTVPAKTLKEFIVFVQSKPGQITCGSPGTGSAQYLGAKLLEKLTGIKLNYVAYKNHPEVMTDLVGGQIHMTVEFASISVPHIQGGKVRALAVAGPVRKPALPDVPTAAEAGLPEFEVVGWNGYFARTGTPPEIIARLNTTLSAAIKGKDFADYTHGLGSEVGGNTPDEFAAFVARENARWEKVVREMGIRVEE